MMNIAVAVQAIEREHPHGEPKAHRPQARRSWDQHTTRATDEYSRWLAGMDRAIDLAPAAFEYLKQYADLEPGWTSSQSRMLRECRTDLSQKARGYPWDAPASEWARWHASLHSLLTTLRTATITEPKTGKGAPADPPAQPKLRNNAMSAAPASMPSQPQPVAKLIAVLIRVISLSGSMAAEVGDLHEEFPEGRPLPRVPADEDAFVAKLKAASIAAGKRWTARSIKDARDQHRRAMEQIGPWVERIEVLKADYAAWNKAVELAITLTPTITDYLKDLVQPPAGWTTALRQELMLLRGTANLVNTRSWRWPEKEQAGPLAKIESCVRFLQAADLSTPAKRGRGAAASDTDTPGQLAWVDRLPPGPLALWNGLAGDCGLAKDLAARFDTSEQTIREHVQKIQDISGDDDIIKNRPGFGYYRPDHPPDWSAIQPKRQRRIGRA